MENKVEGLIVEVREMVAKLIGVDDETPDYHTADQICQLFKIKLPEIPDAPTYSDKPFSDIEKTAFRIGALMYRKRVKELNEVE